MIDRSTGLRPFHHLFRGLPCRQLFGDAATSGATVTPLTTFVLTARFGQCSSNWTACHTGLDFAAAVGRPIRAVQGGRVTFVGWGGRYGRLTKIDHGAGIESWYAHQFTQTVQVGQTVAAGQSIGKVGVTGNTTGPHLHLEIRRGGTPIDPAAWLSGKGAL